jgi:hypothetical protein
MKILRWRQDPKKPSDETLQLAPNDAVKEPPKSNTFTRKQGHTVRLPNVKRIKRAR